MSTPPSEIKDSEGTCKSPNGNLRVKIVSTSSQVYPNVDKILEDTGIESPPVMLLLILSTGKSWSATTPNLNRIC